MRALFCHGHPSFKTLGKKLSNYIDRYKIIYFHCEIRNCNLQRGMEKVSSRI